MHCGKGEAIQAAIAAGNSPRRNTLLRSAARHCMTTRRRYRVICAATGSSRLAHRQRHLRPRDRVRPGAFRHRDVWRRARPHHRHTARHRRSRRPRAAHSLHPCDGCAYGARLPDRHVGGDGDVRHGAGDPVRRARRDRIGSDGARRPPDGEARRGGACLRRVLHVLDLRRVVWRDPARARDPDPAAIHARSRHAGTAGRLHPRPHARRLGEPGQCAQGADRCRDRRAGRGDRRRGTVGSAALDLRRHLRHLLVGRHSDRMHRARPVRGPRAHRYGDCAHQHRLGAAAAADCSPSRCAAFATCCRTGSWCSTRRRSAWCSVRCRAWAPR